MQNSAHFAENKTFVENFLCDVKFVLRRLLKLYSAYWFVLILVIPIGMLVFHQKMPSGGGVAIWLRNIFGLCRSYKAEAFNATWWFCSLIITLYLLFPCLYAAIKRNPIYSLIILLLLVNMHIFRLTDTFTYHWIFVLGMAWAMYAQQITNWLNHINKHYILIALVILFVGLSVLLPYINKIHGGLIYHYGWRYYCILTLALAVLVVCFRNLRYLRMIFSFLGKHATNIWLIHAFFSYYWSPFPRLLYRLNNPVLIFSTLLVGSLLISIVIEWIKEKMGYNKLVKKVVAKLY